MEAHLLKERASGLDCQGRQGMVFNFDNLNYTNAFIAERRIGVLKHQSGEQNVKIVPGRL